MPLDAHELRASRLEQEVAELREKMGCMRQGASFLGPSSSQEAPPAPPRFDDGAAHAGYGGTVGLRGPGLREFACGPGGWPGGDCGRGIECHPDRGPMDHGSSLEAAGEHNYGRWRGEAPSSPAPLPWTEGGGSKAELATLAADASPLELGDWLAVCGPVLRDITAVSARWWNLTLREAQCYYDRWKTASPLERIQIMPRLPDELNDVRYHRTEQRGVNLLLKAIPVDQQQALITDRELTSTALLYRLLVRFQPGGAGEKSILLAKLTSLDKATTVTEWAASLRSWRRHFARAREISAVLPDGTLLLKALEAAVIKIPNLDAQAAFRLAQSRLQLGVDQVPHHDGVWRFSQCLLAEVETLVLMSTAPTTTSSPIKVKQMEAQDKSATATRVADDSRGKGGAMSTTPCKYFRSDSGCKAGKNCKWSHSWEGVDDKASRCWICGGKDHRESDCKLKSQGKTQFTSPSKGTGEPSQGSGGGKPGGAGKSSNGAGGGGSAQPSVVKLQEMELSSEGHQQSPNPEAQPAEGVSKGGGGGGGETGATSTTSETLLQEATKLLKSLRAPQLRVIKISQLEHDPSGQLVLLDSGATHALRPARDQVEWAQAMPTQVTLADGVTDKLKLKAGTKVLLSAPDDDAFGSSWIVPLGGIAELGYKFDWKGSQCSLRDNKGQQLEVVIQHGCPMVDRKSGQEMIDQLERRQANFLKKALLVKTLMENPHSGALAEMPDSLEMALTVQLKALFPSLPEEILMRIVPDMSQLQEGQSFDGHRVPWNRRTRRRLDRAKKIVLHLFSGPDSKYWEKTLNKDGNEVLCVDLKSEVSADLHDDQTYLYLLSLAASGRVKAIIGGPPCRTVSALRYQDDGGPGVLRTEQHPYGLPTLTASDLELVIGDSVLLYRMLALYVLCENVRLPQELQTALAVEQPEDPAHYRPAEEVRDKQFMSIWRTKEWQNFEETYQVKRLHFDQGPMGHTKRKPTTLAVVLRDINILDGIRGPPSGTNPEEPAQDRGQMTMKEKCDDSKTWAAWAPGLKVALVLALQDWLNRGTTPSLEAALRPLTPAVLDSWKQHYQNDHMPARRDCKHCVRSAARSKPHKRIVHPEAYTLSVDLSGKMVPGFDQSRQSCKYMMIAVYTFPVDRAGRPLAEMEGGFPLEGQADHDLPPSDDLEYPQPDLNGDDPGDALLREEPVEEAPNEGEDAAVRACQASFDSWHQLVEDSKDVAVRNLTFVEVLNGRAVNNILQALARIYARLRSLGLPIYRLHSDRARELISAPVRRWTLDRGIVTTLTTGGSFKTNGRVEGELGVVKKHIRTVVAATEVGLDKWPLAAIHIGERRLRGQLRSLGFPSGPLLKFGAKAFALKKSWQERYQPWREVRDEVVILGPAVQSSLTTTSYYVQSVTSHRYFYTDDVVIPSADQPEANDAIVHLPEIGDAAPRPMWHGAIPRRRLREKTAIPQVSMIHMEGETGGGVNSSWWHRWLCDHREFASWWQRWLCDHRDSFEIMMPNDVRLFSLEVSSDSWTIETPERTSSSSSGEDDIQGVQTSSGFPVVDLLGGGDAEGVPNNRCGGSSPVTPQKGTLGEHPHHKIKLLKALQANLAAYVSEEMGHLDVTIPEQGCYLEVLSEAIMYKVEVEEMLLQNDRDVDELATKELEEEFLVTRTVGSKEVWDDFENWVPSITAEYNQLVKTKEAVEQITKRELHQRAEAQGKTIELLPAKMVYTRKAGAGVRRARAVCCGNYSESRFSGDCYAGGADGCQVRALVRTSALKGWTLAATDIRVAFLNAPRREDGKMVAMEIPSVYKRLGLARESEVWLVKLALYGLTTSPRDWSQYRDRTLPMVSWVREREGRNVRGYFVKTADENLWRLEEADTETGENLWTGLMSVYVDDILISGEDSAVSAALTSLQATWTTSSVEKATPTSPVHFCGFEISADEHGDGFHLSQQKYEQEILTRWNVKEASTFPNFKVSETDMEPPDSVDKVQIREAQALAGSLLWLSTRSRPDLAYGVAALSRLVTRNPAKAIEIGQSLLAYVKGTPGDLHYPQKIKKKWGSRDQLKIQRHEGLLEVFADIAYGTGSNHRSVQGLVICFAGAPVAWQSATQPFVTHSTAEAELVSYCEALCTGRATEALLCAMWGEPLDNSNVFERVIYGDNAAAISLAYGNSATSWRTRHLRVRSNILKEALDEQGSYPGGCWKLAHLRGTELVADGMTKPLLGQSFAGFFGDLGLKPPEVKVASLKLGQNAPPVPDHQLAVRAIVAGSALVRAAEAGGSQDSDAAFGSLMLCGIVLVLIGAIWVAKAAVSSFGCCLRRLHGVTCEPPSSSDLPEADEGAHTTSLRSRRARSGGRTDQGTNGVEATETEEETEEEAQAIRRRRAARPSDDDDRDDREGTSMTGRRSMSQTSRRRSGSLHGTSSRSMRRRSSESNSVELQAASEAADDAVQAASQAAEGAERAAESAHQAAAAANLAAVNAEAATTMLQHALRAKAKASPVVRPIRRVEEEPTNPWNRFQRHNANKGWNLDKMRAEYYRAKSMNSLP